MTKNNFKLKKIQWGKILVWGLWALIFLFVVGGGFGALYVLLAFVINPAIMNFIAGKLKLDAAKEGQKTPIISHKADASNHGGLNPPSSSTSDTSTDTGFLGQQQDVVTYNTDDSWWKKRAKDIATMALRLFGFHSKK